MSNLGIIACLGRHQRKHGRRAFRGKFTSKFGPKSFYKGRGSRSLGRIDSKGHFHYQESKLPEIVVPDLTDFPLKPYVAYNTPLIKTPQPTVPHLNLSESEVDILDIVAPQHASLRRAKQAVAEKPFPLEEEKASAPKVSEMNRK
jgi:large subunit ribosomal protein L41